MKKQNGFTLIELVIVIVILGILAAVAVPKFVDLEDEASKAAVEGVAGAIASASSINYAAYKTSVDRDAYTPKITGSNADVCTNANLGAIMQGGLPDGYLVEPGGTVAADGVAYCDVCNDVDENGTCGTEEPTAPNVPIVLTE